MTCLMMLRILRWLRIFLICLILDQFDLDSSFCFCIEYNFYCYIYIILYNKIIGTFYRNRWAALTTD
jgi:hypothetical protein